jgi:hypothetical protein
VRAVASGGVALMQRLVQAVGLDKEIRRRVHLLKIRAPYHDSDYVTNIASNLLAGGESNSRISSCSATTRTTPTCSAPGGWTSLRRQGGDLESPTSWNARDRHPH